MQVAETIAQCRRAVAEARASGKVVGFVPTMGALHEGHYQLIDAARRECGFVVVSIFVNPTQFAPGEDLSRYPRTPQADLAGCERRGADLVFLPGPAEMYPRGRTEVEVTPGRLAETLCGRSRPGHFAGVCTVVAKLLNIVQPQKAYFGAKDFQQAVIVARMVEDLDFPVEVVRCPTVREADGLAMSSRNRYLSPAERAQAAALSRALAAAEEIIRSGPRASADVVAAVRERLAAEAPDGQIDYVQVVDPRTLEDVEVARPAVLVALAVRFGGARLIDNVLVDGPAAGG